jgi:hypothetical protein
MVFTKRLREGVRSGRITSSIRVWKTPRVKVGGQYQMDEGFIVVDSIEEISFRDITQNLAVESGFSSVDDLLQVAKHGTGERVFLVQFHYLPPGVRDTVSWRQRSGNI